ncbi:MAG: hypothetical protein ACRDRJ_03625 [Streptosporangiaceae bacterium]
MDEDATAVIEHAQRIIYQASWHILEEAALAGLAGTRGLRRAPLEPRSDVIQLVTYDGQHIGHVRRDHTCAPGETWVAIRRLPGRPVGCYPSPSVAAVALAVACGKGMPQHG